METADSDARVFLAPGRLWSLWDMIEFQLKPFLNLQDVLAQMSVLIHSGDERLHPEMQEINKDDLRELLGQLIPQLKLLELQVCIIAAERMLSTLERTSDTKQILTDIDCVRRQILDHMDLIYCLSISADNKKLYSPSGSIFGDDVDRAFSNLSEDLSEAGKCLALCRYTACVFHLMRAMEGSLSILCNKIGATYANKYGESLEWGVLLKNINDKITGMQPGKLKDEWSEVTTLLYHVKQAWRNSTMHPKQTYTEEEAKAVFSSVKSFMIRLSSFA